MTVTVLNCHDTVAMLFGVAEKPSKWEKRLQECLDELEDVKRQVRSLQIEWESTYNKIRSILARFNKRDEREEEAAVAAGKPARAPRALGNGDQPPPHLPGPTERNY